MPSDIHDTFFKKLATQRDFLIQFFRIYLPKKIQKHLDWDSIEVAKLNNEFLPYQRGKKRQADLLYSFNYDQGKTGLLLAHIEHQSSPDKWLPLRMEGYARDILREYVDARNPESLPVLIQLVFYHGKVSPYPFSMKMIDLFADKELAKKCMKKPKLIDITTTSDKVISRHGLIAPGEYVLKYAHKKRPGAIQLQTFVELCKKTYRLNNCLPESSIIVLEYSFETWDYHSEQLIQKLSRYGGAKMTSVANRLRAVAREEGVQFGMQQGVQQGVKQGVRQIAIKLLEKGVDIKVVADVSDLSIDVLQSLKKEKT